MAMDTVALGFFLNKAWDLISTWRGQDAEKKQLRAILRKALLKFVLDWEQTVKFPIPNIYENLNSVVTDYREDLLQMTVNIETLLGDEVYARLLVLTETMQRAAAAGDRDTSSVANLAAQGALDIIELLEDD